MLPKPPNLKVIDSGKVKAILDSDEVALGSQPQAGQYEFSVAVHERRNERLMIMIELIKQLLQQANSPALLVS